MFSPYHLFHQRDPLVLAGRNGTLNCTKGPICNIRIPTLQVDAGITPGYLSIHHTSLRPMSPLRIESRVFGTLRM